MSKKNGGNQKWGLSVSWNDGQFWGDEGGDDEVIDVFSPKYKKSIDRDFDSILSEIEMTRMQLYEVDKRVNKKSRKKTNGKEREFYYSMKSIEARQKISKKWEKTGFLDTVLGILNMVAPIIKMIAIKIAELINIFMSSAYVKESLPTSFISKLVTVHDIALCV